jgi:hypothetical protein
VLWPSWIVAALAIVLFVLSLPLPEWFPIGTAQVHTTSSACLIRRH